MSIADAIEKQTGIETRCVVLGHLQRGGPPSAYDRILATRLGLAASRLVLQKRFGTMVTLAGTVEIVETAMNESVAATKTLDLRLLRRGRGVLPLNRKTVAGLSDCPSAVSIACSSRSARKKSEGGLTWTRVC